MAQEVITVEVAGQRYGSWIDLNVRAAFHEACRSFSFEVAAATGVAATNKLFASGTPLRILAGDDLLVDGYVNRRVPRFDPEKATITVAGRAKGQDHVDCSCEHETGWFENQDPLAIANALGQAEARFRSDRQLEPLDYWQVTPGETRYDAVQDMCRDQGMTLCGQPDGDILITDASRSKRHAGRLAQGLNLTHGEGDFSDENRHSETHVRGQLSRGTGHRATRQAVVARDHGIRRRRVHIHHHHGHAHIGRLKKHAADRRNRKSGGGIRARLVTPSWRDEDGTLWTPGYRVFVESELLALEQDMLLESIDFSCRSVGQGVTAHIGVVDPQAYGGKAGKASASGAQWGMDASDAEELS